MLKFTNISMKLYETEYFDAPKNLKNIDFQTNGILLNEGYLTCIYGLELTRFFSSLFNSSEKDFILKYKCDEKEYKKATYLCIKHYQDILSNYHNYSIVDYLNKFYKRNDDILIKASDFFKKYFGINLNCKLNDDVLAFFMLFEKIYNEYKYIIIDFDFYTLINRIDYHYILKAIAKEFNINISICTRSNSYNTVRLFDNILAYFTTTSYIDGPAKDLIKKDYLFDYRSTKVTIKDKEEIILSPNNIRISLYPEENSFKAVIQSIIFLGYTYLLQCKVLDNDAFKSPIYTYYNIRPEMNDIVYLNLIK